MNAQKDSQRLFLSCLGAASIAALGIAMAEALLAGASPNALLSALPVGEQVRYLALIVLLFPALALPAAFIGWLVSLKAPRVGNLLAALSPCALVAVESLRHAGEFRGSLAPILGSIALLWCLLVGLFALKRPVTLTIPLTLTVLIGAGIAVPVLLSTQPSGEAEEPSFELAAASGPSVHMPRSRNLLVLMIDTLRADHLGCYGYKRDTSPKIDAFAKEGALFENAATPKPKTSPAIASFFTGTWPETHKVHQTRTELVEENITLAETLKQAGFLTFGLTANANITSTLGYGQGFDALHWVTRMELKDGTKVDNNAEQLALGAVQWMAQHREERFFVYVHFIDPHTPYRPPGPYATMFQGDELDGRLGTEKLEILEKDYIDGIQKAVYLEEAGFNLDRYVSRYDGEIRFNDNAIGKILEALEKLGLGENTAVVVTADHGESAVEHHAYFNHGLFAYEEQVHIPLVIRGPGIPAGLRRAEQVSLVGLMPTLLDLVGVAPPEQVEVDSFCQLLMPDTPTAEGQPTLLSTRGDARTRTTGLRTNRWKYLLNPLARSRETAFQLENLVLPDKRFDFSLNGLRNYELQEELYDLEADPLESENLAYRNRGVRDGLRRQMEALRGACVPVASEPRVFSADEFTQEVRDDLKQLGYLGK
ncbi:MAG: sulfatase-like hydrolase/transferase [Planctomycetota bacterium]